MNLSRSILGSTVRPFGICAHADDLHPFADQPSLVPIDLSKVIGLKAVTFGWARDFQWAIKALRTVTHDNINLQQLSFDAAWTSYGPNVGDDDLNELLSDIGETSYQEWLKLDNVLAQLWESHSIRPEVTYNVPRGMDEVAECRMQILLPEVTTRGIVDLVRLIYEW